MKKFLLLPLLLLLAGCAGYQLGPVKPHVMNEVQTIGIPTFRNETLEPDIEVLVTNTIIKQLHEDGTYELVPDQAADAVLYGTISEIIRRPQRSVRGNVLATREFDLELLINYEVMNRETGELIMGRQVRGTTDFFVSADVQQDERQAIPQAAQDAAVDLVSQISEGW